MWLKSEKFELVSSNTKLESGKVVIILSSPSFITRVWQRKYQVIYYFKYLNPQGECILPTRLEGGGWLEVTEREVRLRSKKIQQGVVKEGGG